MVTPARHATVEQEDLETAAGDCETKTGEEEEEEGGHGELQTGDTAHLLRVTFCTFPEVTHNSRAPAAPPESPQLLEASHLQCGEVTPEHPLTLRLLRY